MGGAENLIKIKMQLATTSSHDGCLRPTRLRKGLTVSWPASNGDDLTTLFLKFHLLFPPFSSCSWNRSLKTPLNIQRPHLPRPLAGPAGAGGKIELANGQSRRTGRRGKAQSAAALHDDFPASPLHLPPVRQVILRTDGVIKLCSCAVAGVLRWLVAENLPWSLDFDFDS